MIATAVCSRLLALSLEHTLLCAVHSVFDHAVNLEAEGRAGLIGLIAWEQTLTPFAVSVREERAFAWTGVRAGMAAAVRGGRITIAEAEIEVDLTRAESADLSVDSIPIRTEPRQTAWLLEKITGALIAADKPESLSPLVTGGQSNPYTRFLAPRLELLFAAVSAGAADAAQLAAERIAGCGMGLTPSSDDLLCGYFCALYLLCRTAERGHLRGLVPRMAQAAAERTNRISATFLLNAGEGLVNLAVCDLVRSTYQFLDEAAADRAIGRILAIGSTSGADLLTGMALALKQHNGGNEPW